MTKHSLHTLLAALFLAAPGSASAQDQGAGQEVPAAGAALPPLDQVMMLRLRDGTIHWGAILEHSSDGLRFQLLDNGGIAAVPWSLLAPALEEELRERFGYVDVSTEEIYVDVDRLLLVDGGEVTGVILSREGDHFVVKVDGNLQVVPKTRVESVAGGHRLPALDVYTREELYGMFSAEADASDAASQLDLARRCEQILDFAHAVAHYEAALELDEDAGAEVQFALERARARAAQQEQIDYLRGADLLRKRGRFDEALVQLDAFTTIFPGSPLMENAMKTRERVIIGRDEALRTMVRSRWDYWMRRIARSEAAKLDHASAVAFAQEGLGQAIRAAVLADLKTRVSEHVSEDDVEEYWATRKRVRYDNASYGFGTWLLGEDRARAGTEKSAAQAEPPSEKEDERAKLDEKIKRFLESQRAQRRARSQAEMADDHETYWASFPPVARSNWIRAYYVEFSGDWELRDHPTLSACSSCGGTGVHEVLSIGGAGTTGDSGALLVTCSTCRGAGILRRVYYR